MKWGVRVIIFLLIGRSKYREDIRSKPRLAGDKSPPTAAILESMKHFCALDRKHRNGIWRDESRTHEPGNEKRGPLIRKVICSGPWVFLGDMWNLEGEEVFTPSFQLWTISSWIGESQTHQDYSLAIFKFHGLIEIELIRCWELKTALLGAEESYLCVRENVEAT